MISCIILAAGESRRFGSPKALATVGALTVIHHIQKTLLDAGLEEILVVLGADAELIKLEVFNHTQVRVVHNKDYKLGQTSSFQAGVREASAPSRGFMLLPVDYPCIGRSTIEHLARHFVQNQMKVLVPLCEGRRGHPPVFHADLREDILALAADEGVNSLYDRHPPSLLQVKDTGVLQTFNTPQELQQIISGSKLSR